ncbi:MAG: hypothetical protein HY063_13075 [Bacteroidetes bacterium]|nr:hypothetical protein [Bacteroidota bacterium]
MTNQIDQLFNSVKEEQKKTDEAQRQVWRKQNAFVADFKNALAQIIHPAMIDILSNLRGRHCQALALKRRRDKSSDLPHIKPFAQPPAIDVKSNLLYKDYENYYIAAPELAQGIALIITVLGNYALQQISVIAEYVNDREDKPPRSLKKTEQQFSLAQITPELFNSLVAEKIKEMISIKQQQANQNNDLAEKNESEKTEK